MVSLAPKKTRLVAKVSKDLHEIVSVAAELSGETLSQFIVEALTSKAREVIEREHTIRLTVEGADAVFEALENPPPINEKLREAARKFKENGGFHKTGEGNIP
ncbi:DUF1778 domain-containing protein [Aestuariicella sp. G3-2]|uniref:type II toxin-antitoxin system TacA family antitoxin n=1 Tax=Pseudomaricurvus albidus TaxID=2842452 RepID=UPI001C0D18B8|nr:DUF1778 domain-containing protein [Aestuariicella albida]MBU3068259.1 DUF1778 domain-containing protein [Aestuariicella albida]